MSTYIYTILEEGATVERGHQVLVAMSSSESTLART